MRFAFTALVVAWPVAILITLVGGSSWLIAAILDPKLNLWVAIAAVSAWCGWLHLRVRFYVTELRERDHQIRTMIATMETRIAQKRGL